MSDTARAALDALNIDAPHKIRWVMWYLVACRSRLGRVPPLPFCDRWYSGSCTQDLRCAAILYDELSIGVDKPVATILRRVSGRLLDLTLGYADVNETVRELERINGRRMDPFLRRERVH